MNSDPSRDESGVCEREVLFIYGQSPRGTFVVCRVKNQIPKFYTLLLAIGIYLTVCEQSVDWKAFGIFLKNWLIHNVSSFYLLLPKCLILFLFGLSSPKWNILRPRVASWYVKMQLVSMVVKLDLCARTKVRHTGPLAYDPVYNPYMLINMIFFSFVVTDHTRCWSYLPTHLFSRRKHNWVLLLNFQEASCKKPGFNLLPGYYLGYLYKLCCSN